ncbi:MAG: helix-turn-helix domain-containing protein [Monoglobaceae bacterium]
MKSVALLQRRYIVTLGEKIKALRTAKKMSQKELAERIGIAKSVISFYESGDRFPSYDVLIKIARIFNVTTDYLLDVERERTVNVSGLSEEDIAAVTTVIDALKRKNNG